MARRALSASQLSVVQAVRAGLDAETATSVQTVRVACSGGADSLALAAGLAWLDAHEPDPLRRSCAMVVDHGLQPGSNAVAASVAQVLDGLGLPATVVAVHVDGVGGLEASARDARYTALTSGDVDTVLVGQTMDDQAETVLLGLARGSGTRSLAGMAPVSHRGRVRLVRPLLGLRRGTTVQACADWGLSVWHDPMNQDSSFARVRARRLLPELDAALGPGVVEALARTAALARVDADQLDAEAAHLLAQTNLDAGLPVAVVREAPVALPGRLVRQWLAGYGVLELSHERTEAVLRLVDQWHGQSGVDLPGGAQVVRMGNQLTIRQTADRL